MNGAERPNALDSCRVVKAATAVPPVPMPKMPRAAPRRAGGCQALTNGTPTAKEVPPMPRKNPPTSRAVRLVPKKPRKRTGTIVRTATAGNITLAPRRSVSAPTGMRPSEPTRTGVATTSDCCSEVRPSSSRSVTARGESSAQAQKQMAKPSVAMMSMVRAVAGSGTPAAGTVPAVERGVSLMSGWPFGGSGTGYGARETCTTEHSGLRCHLFSLN